MVGVSTALALQSSGRKTALVDRREPGQEASFGNAGIIQAEAVTPYGFPLDLATLGRIAIGRSGAVRWNLRGVFSSTRPLAAYLRNSLPATHARISERYGRMIRKATEDHERQIGAANADRLVRRDGFIEVFRSSGSLAAGIKEAERARSSFGVNSSVLDGDELAKAEPGLRGEFAGAIHWTDSWSCNDPSALVSAYANLFRSRGGEIHQGDANSLNEHEGSWIVSMADRRVSAYNVVVSLGAWSPGLLKRFGYNFPMILKRGYHRHVDTGSGPRLPVVDADNAVVFSPMTAGLRVLTGAELTPINGPVNRTQIDRATALAGEMFDASIPEDSPIWYGTRPCMPNMLPVVGPAPRHHGLWFNFGHGHQGFTLGPTTARILAAKMDGLADEQAVP